MANNFVGEWNCAWTGGHHRAEVLTINADGTGTYDTSDGKITGTFSDGNLSLSGTWTQSGGYSGPFTFVLQGDTIFGVWGSSDGNPGGLWNGTRNA